MALFSRRILQRVLDESGSYLDEKQQEELCNLLNSVRDDYLANEWEHVLLNAFSKLGKIEYERCIAGSRKPDLLFECSSPPLRFLADIKTISDLGLKKLNPVEPLQGEFLRYLGKHKMLGGGFHLRVDSHPSKVFRGSKDPLRSKLPSISQFHSKIF